jgi:NAD(P)-dependent dehydrogenase (short-subunit alcohol dehydrogenase family)
MTDNKTSGVIIVTGANSGLGLWTTKYLLNLNFRVIMACRDVEKTKIDIAALPEFDQNKSYTIKQLDLADFQSIRNFVADLSPNEDIYGLDCNAGFTYQTDFRYTKQGIEETFGVNHLGHFYLTNLLLDKFPIKKIVVISSELHDPSTKAPLAKAVYRPIFEMAYPKKDSRSLATQTQEFYANSKLCNVFFTYALAQKLTGKTLVNAYNPGFMPTTNFGRTGKIANLILSKVMSVLGSIFGFTTTAKASAKYVARLFNEEAQTGKYFEKDKAVKSSKESYDENKVKELWDNSEKLVKSILETK